MSLTELKEKVAALTPDQRLELAAFLAELENRSKSDFQRTVDQRMKAMDAGNKVTSEEFEAKHVRRQ